jgi:hypothetical protein
MKTPKQIRDAANNPWSEPAPKPLSQQDKPEPASKGVPMFAPPRDLAELEALVGAIAEVLPLNGGRDAALALLRIRQGAADSLE